MASLRSPRRRRSPLTLTATVAATERLSRQPDQAQTPPFGWLAAAVGGGLAAALVGWIVVCGFTVLAWLTAAPGDFAGVLGAGSRIWMLANGAGTQLGTLRITLVPYAATVLFALLLSSAAGWAGRQAHRQGWRGDPAPAEGAGWRSWATVAAVSLASYLAPVVVAGWLTGAARPAWPGLLGVLAVLTLAAGRGASRGLGYRPSASWPGWARGVLRGCVAAQLVLLLAGTVAVGAGIVLHLDRVALLSSQLHAGVSGGLLLWVAQLLFLPDAMVWAASYALGAGFSLGSGSVVTPAATELGLLPSVPLLGALPRPGSGDTAQLWWLAAGVLAGCLAAAVAVRHLPSARLDQLTLVGALAGVLGGLVFVAVAWACSGDLGAVRLAGVGPRLLPLTVMAVSTLGLAGMGCGLVIGLLRGGGLRRRDRRRGGADDAEAGAGTERSEETVSVGALETAGSPLSGGSR